MASPTEAPQRVFVGKRMQFTDGARQLVKCGTRNVAVVCHGDRIYAIDNACYHHGGPLLRGDIEEMGGHPCIVCPWHSYKIALDTGEGLYLGISVNPRGGPPEQTVKSKGCKQRVHRVVVDAAENVFVEVDLSGPAWESDAYAAMALANREGATAAPLDFGSGGRSGGVHLSGSGIHSSIPFGARSGHVFRQLGQLHTGRGGTNPFEGTQKVRPPLSPTLLHSSARSRGGCRPNACTNLFVACASVTDVCAGVRAFDFIHHSGPLLRQAELGEHVELELPIKERTPFARGSARDGAALLPSSSVTTSSSSTGAGEGQEWMRRLWTICDMNHKGSLFTLIVKAQGTDPQKSGSAWLHQLSLQTPLRVCNVGGTFTFADHVEDLRRLHGNMLWITAGIGITSAYAAMNSSLDDAFFAESDADLHVVHLHANHTLDTVAMLDKFAQWQLRFPRQSDATSTAPSGAHKKSYTMELHISTPANEEASSDSSSGNSSRRSSPRQRSSALSYSVAAAPLPLTHRRRLCGEDVVQAVQNYFGSEMPLAYVCGPPAFISDCSDALLSVGLPESQILTDDW